MTNHFCEVCLDQRQFSRVEIEEEVTIKDETFDVLHEYDQCEICEELFEPIEDIDKNIKLDFRKYRKKVGFLQPEEIKEIREKYGMNLRQFAELLGIGYSTLSHIENGSLQSWYQNSLFLLVKSPTSMYSLLSDRLIYTKENYDDVLKRVEKLSKEEYEELFKIARELEEQMDWLSEKTLINTRRINDLELDIGESGNKNYTSVNREEKLFSWNPITNLVSPS